MTPGRKCCARASVSSILHWSTWWLTSLQLPYLSRLPQRDQIDWFLHLAGFHHSQYQPPPQRHPAESSGQCAAFPHQSKHLVKLHRINQQTMPGAWNQQLQRAHDVYQGYCTYHVVPVPTQQLFLLLSFHCPDVLVRDPQLWLVKGVGDRDRQRI